MRSCLYRLTTWHQRLAPRPHAFRYRLFMFLLDLDEMDALFARSRLVSRDRPTPYRFRDADYLPSPGGRIRQNVERALAAKGVEARALGRIEMLASLRFLGHVFNPVVFYYAYDKAGRPAMAFAEVTNTFREKKLYLVPRYEAGARRFVQSSPKRFYISPFSPLDAAMRFEMGLPAERLTIRVEERLEGRLFFRAGLEGRRLPLSDAALLGQTARIPFATLKVIGLIHWQALKLRLRGFPFFRKADRPDLQTDLHPNPSLPSH